MGVGCGDLKMNKSSVFQVGPQCHVYAVNIRSVVDNTVLACVHFLGLQTTQIHLTKVPLFLNLCI